MERVYEINIAGLKRRLPLCAVNEHLDIAAFIIFGDVELTVAACKELLEKVKNFDVIATPEAKSIPLAYELSRQSGKPYVVARKGPKVYMRNPISVDVTSITTQHEQHLFLGNDDVAMMNGKKVLIIDDVISTGESLDAMKKLVNRAGGIITDCCAILAEGEAAKRDDIVFLEPLPVFFK